MTVDFNFATLKPLLRLFDRDKGIYTLCFLKFNKLSNLVKLQQAP